MAIRTHGCLGIAFIHDFGAMHRFRIALDLLGMTLLAANFRHRQVPLSALGSSAWRHIEIVGVVAIVAGRIGAGFIVGARPRMIGILVRLDILDHYSQSCFFFGQILLLHGFPQRLVASHAIGLRRRAFLVRRLVAGDVLVTGHARHLAVHAFSKQALLDCLQGARLPVRSSRC